MAIEQINEDTFDYAMFLDTLIESYKGKQSLTITNFDNDSAPQVTNGSVFENTGTLFRNTALATPTGYAGISNSTTFYLYLDVEPTPTFIFSSVAPAWSDEKQGWYNGNDRAFFSMFKDSGGTLYENKNRLITNNSFKGLYLHVQDQKSAATGGGTSSSGVNIRTLNTELLNTIPGSSLASNQITLPAGIYKIQAKTISYRSDAARAYMYNTTDASDSIIGFSNYTASGSNVTVNCIVEGIITLAAIKVLELRLYYAAGATASGLGVVVNDGKVEVYSDVFIEKIG